MSVRVWCAHHVSDIYLALCVWANYMPFSCSESSQELSINLLGKQAIGITKRNNWQLIRYMNAR